MTRPNHMRAVMALVLLCSAPAIAPLPAHAQSAQTAPILPLKTIDKLAVRVDWVRYENVSGNRPSVLVYATVQNVSSGNVLLAASTFENTALTIGGSVYTAKGYTFAQGNAPGQEGVFTAGKILTPGLGTLVAFRYQLMDAAPRNPVSWTVRERPLLILPGKKPAVREVTLSVPGYAAPPAPPPLATPPERQISNPGIQAGRFADTSFRKFGPLRVRMDYAIYDRIGHVKNPAVIHVQTTVQNTLAVPLQLDSASLQSMVIDESGRSTRHESNGLFKEPARFERYTLAPGEWMSANYYITYPDEAGFRAARRVSLIYASYEEAGGSLTMDLPRFVAPSKPVEQKRTEAAPPADVPATSTAAGGFQPTAYLDVQVDRMTRLKDGVELILSVRNRSGERRGIQQDWQKYALAGPDGAEYRTDGNFYGASVSDHPRTTTYLDKDGEGKLTFLFPAVPSTVTPTSLIVRENGVEKARLPLPR